MEEDGGPGCGIVVVAAVVVVVVAGVVVVYWQAGVPCGDEASP